MSVKKSSTTGARVMLTAFGATLALFAATGHASEDPLQKTVRYGDLNLSKSEDASELYARLQRAAAVVCRTDEGIALRLKRVHKACAEQALSAAVAQVGDPALTALHKADARIRVAQRRSPDDADG